MGAVLVLRLLLVCWVVRLFGSNLGEKFAVFLDKLSALRWLQLKVDRAEHEYLYCFSGSHECFLPWRGVYPF